jgi:MFS family permease
MTQAAATRNPMPWLIIIAGSLIAVLTFGPRSAMGFFQLPMLADTGWDRSTFGLAMAIQNLSWGLGQPIFGALADKYGTGRMLALSGLLYAAGLILMSTGASVTSCRRWCSGGACGCSRLLRRHPVRIRPQRHA